jgi:Elongation factor P (EF-P) KOW-like domain/Elongation factor P, C-terminal
MAKINWNQITPGTFFDHDGGLWVAVKTNAVKPGKGGYKPAVLENRLRIVVPPFIGSGEVTYMRRAD